MNEKPEFEVGLGGKISAKGCIHIVYRDSQYRDSYGREPGHVPGLGWVTMCGLPWDRGLPCVREAIKDATFAPSRELRVYHNAYSKEDYCPKCIKGIPLADLARMDL